MTFVGLNALGLKVRAFDGLLELAPGRAVELARTIQVDVPARSCDDASAFDPAGAFDIARHDADTLSREVLAVRSSTQLGPAFEAILAANGPLPTSQSLVIGLTGTMRQIADDDIAFTDSIDRTWEAIRHVVEAVNDDSMAAYVLDAFRTYLVSHLSGDRCSGEIADALIDDVNQALQMHDLPRVASGDRTPSRLLPVSVGASPALWQTAASQRLRMQVRALRSFKEARRPADDGHSIERDDALATFYADLAAWHAADEPSNEVYLFERDVLLEALVQILPAGADRIRAIRDVVEFLRANGRSLFTNDAYASRVRGLIDHCRNSPDAWAAALESLRDSEDPIMRFYAEVEGLARPR